MHRPPAESVVCFFLAVSWGVNRRQGPRPRLLPIPCCNASANRVIKSNMPKLRRELGLRGGRIARFAVALSAAGRGAGGAESSSREAAAVLTTATPTASRVHPLLDEPEQREEGRVE